MDVKKGTLLVVEDEGDLLDLLRRRFRAEGYRVVSARSAEAGLAAFRKHRPDLVVLDIMLPRMDGLDMARELRKVSEAPIIFLTARKSEMDRVLGLKLGGDDYVTKPFSMRELAARVELRLRKTARPPVERRREIAAGSLRLDFRRHEFRVGGRLRELTPKEAQLLKQLVDAKGEVVSRVKLLEQVWGHACAGELNTRTVDQHIARLRGKLGAEGRRIKTVKKMGYRFIAA
ncbi:MAG: response regulator transcription factor [Elusimicrobiota bacterium]